MSAIAVVPWSPLEEIDMDNQHVQMYQGESLSFEKINPHTQNKIAWRDLQPGFHEHLKSYMAVSVRTITESQLKDLCAMVKTFQDLMIGETDSLSSIGDSKSYVLVCKDAWRM